MKRPRLLIGILIGLHVVLAALILWRYGTMQPYEIIGLDALLIVLLPSQGNLIGFWTALGGKRTPWRVTFTVVGIVACLVVCDWCHYHDPFSHAVLLFVWQTISVGVLLLLARLAGLRLRQIGSEHMEGELRRFQFLLWQMLVWTTVLAVVGVRPTISRRGSNPISTSILLWPGQHSVVLVLLWCRYGLRWADGGSWPALFC